MSASQSDDWHCIALQSFVLQGTLHAGTSVHGENRDAQGTCQGGRRRHGEQPTATAALMSLNALSISVDSSWMLLGPIELSYHCLCLMATLSMPAQVLNLPSLFLHVMEEKLLLGLPADCSACIRIRFIRLGIYPRPPGYYLRKHHPEPITPDGLGMIVNQLLDMRKHSTQEP